MKKMTKLAVLKDAEFQSLKSMAISRPGYIPIWNYPKLKQTLLFGVSLKKKRLNRKSYAAFVSSDQTWNAQFV